MIGPLVILAEIEYEVNSLIYDLCFLNDSV